jgi:hypothetical protein
MTRARIRLIVAAALFLGWVAWLGYAVLQKGRTVVVSRAQLTAATHLLVAEVALGPDGLPASRVKIVQVVRGDGAKAGDEAEVLNLPAALPPGDREFPGPGPYLLAVVGDGKTYTIAPLPPSPGYDAGTYSSKSRPPVYRWTDDTRLQLKGLGVVP